MRAFAVSCARFAPTPRTVKHCATVASVERALRACSVRGVMLAAGGKALRARNDTALRPAGAALRALLPTHKQRQTGAAGQRGRGAEERRSRGAKKRRRCEPVCVLVVRREAKRSAVGLSFIARPRSGRSNLAGIQRQRGEPVCMLAVRHEGPSGPECRSWRSARQWEERSGRGETRHSAPLARGCVPYHQHTGFVPYDGHPDQTILGTKRPPVVR